MTNRSELLGAVSRRRVSQTGAVAVGGLGMAEAAAATGVAKQTEDVSEAGIEEAINLAGNTRYFSTLLHGNEYEHDDFVAETDEIFDYVREQARAAADD